MRVAALALAILLTGCMAPGVPAPGTGASTSTTGLTSTTDPPTSMGTSSGVVAAQGAIVQANTDFAMDVLRESMADAGGENVFLSPLSISTALAMAYEGAAGSTREAMRGALGYPDDPQFRTHFRELLDQLAQPRGVDLEVGNSMWIDEDFEPAVAPAYREAVVATFDAEVEVMDFRAPSAHDAVNHWASEQTRGKVPKVLDSISNEEVMFLVNAVYFRGDWASPFNETCTHEASFARSDGSQVMVDMMCGHARRNVTAYVGSDVSVARLPYDGLGVSMYVLVPPEGTKLSDYVASLDGRKLDATLGKARSAGIEVLLPKFSLKTHLDLKPALERLGMGVAFTPEADFTGIARDLFLSRVLHDAVVEVDEKGTVAAAVTTVGVGVTSLPPRVVAERPFLAVIRDEGTGSVLFAGAVEDPTSE